jgi:hypothetical protein
MSNGAPNFIRNPTTSGNVPQLKRSIKGDGRAILGLLTPIIFQFVLWVQAEQDLDLPIPQPLHPDRIRRGAAFLAPPPLPKRKEEHDMAKKRRGRTDRAALEWAISLRVVLRLEEIVLRRALSDLKIAYGDCFRRICVRRLEFMTIPPRNEDSEHICAAMFNANITFVPVYN